MQDIKMYVMFNGSQCSVNRTGLIWSYFLVLVSALSRLAAVFWTSWRFVY